MENLYLSDSEENDAEFAEIPSDKESAADDDFTSDEETGTAAQPRSLDLLSDSDSEDDRPLVDLIRKQQASDIPKSKYWHRNNSPLKNVLQFSSDSGIPDHIKDLDDVTSGTLFQLFFTDEFFYLLVFQTSLYAEQIGKPYKPTDQKEIKTLIGINLLMGIKKLPSYRDYWSSSNILNDSCVSSLMPVKRFSWLLGHLHINDNSLQPRRSDPDFDKLYKVRPLLTHLLERFS